MQADWVASSVRARLLLRHRLGPAGARELAQSPDWEAALRTLQASPYGDDIAVGMTLDEAQHAVLAVTAWNLRVLVGWLPTGSRDNVRSLGAWFELLNTEQHLALLSGARIAGSGVRERPAGDGRTTGDEAVPPLALGSLATAWERIRESRTVADLREALKASAWGDPGTSDPPGIHVALRLSWADRMIRADLPEAWGAGMGALVIARTRFASERDDLWLARAPRTFGRAWRSTADVVDLARRLPEPARWVLAGVESADDLWAAEARWWQGLEQDGRGMLARSRPSADVVTGVAAVLLGDLWRTQAALAAAAVGPAAREAFHAAA